jgi:hypothetical protein
MRLLRSRYISTLKPLVLSLFAKRCKEVIFKFEGVASPSSMFYKFRSVIWNWEGEIGIMEWMSIAAVSQ